MKLTMTKRRWMRDSGITDRMEEKWVAGGARKMMSQPTPNAGEIIMYGPIVDDELAAWWLDDYPEDERFLVHPSGVREAFAKNSGNITIRLNSPGGDVASASAIGGMQDDRMNSGSTVDMRVDGDAMSAASTLMVRATNRIIDPMGMVMIHRPLTLELGNEDDMTACAERLNKHGRQIADLYADRTGLSATKAYELMTAETYMTAKEAVEHGFADSVLTVDRGGDTPDNMDIATAMLVSAQAISARRRRFYTSLRGEA